MPDLRGPDRQPAFIGIPTYIHSPLALSPEELAEMQADVAVIGAPVDMGVVNRPGARFGPRAIRQAGYAGSPNETFYHMEFELYPTQELKVVDFGDANCPPSLLDQSHEAVRLKTMQALQAGAIPLVLGGDHSITLPAATAVAQHHGYGRVGMIHFDAHADTGRGRIRRRAHRAWQPDAPPAGVRGRFRGGTSYRSGCAGTGRTVRCSTGCENRGCAGT